MFYTLQFIDRMEATFLRAIQQQIENAKHDRDFLNNWHLANGAKDGNRFRSEFLKIRSTGWYLFAVFFNELIEP